MERMISNMMTVKKSDVCMQSAFEALRRKMSAYVKHHTSFQMGMQWR